MVEIQTRRRGADDADACIWTPSSFFPIYLEGRSESIVSIVSAGNELGVWRRRSLLLHRQPCQQEPSYRTVIHL